MIRGFIVCAGHQKRFKSNKPKALMEVNGKTLLKYAYESLEPLCDDVYVVCSNENESFFTVNRKIVEYEQLGCGYAVYRALSLFDWEKGDKCFIQWGDSYTDCYQSCTEYDDELVIPVRWEEKPYVKIDENGAYFSKYGEDTANGYHDLSLFFGDGNKVLESLQIMKDKYYQSGEFIHKHGNELNFLDILNETDIKYKLVECKKTKSFGFNTIEEYNKICQAVVLEKN